MEQGEANAARLNETPIDAEALRVHYGRFLGENAAGKNAAPERLLLTGHSHQAWPDVARAGVLEAFDDAARHVDDKWSRAAEAAKAVQDYVASALPGGGTSPDDVLTTDGAQIALAQNTHELVTRFLSAALAPSRFGQTPRRHIVTTAGEFHSMRRQLLRLEEEGLEVSWVPVSDGSSLAAGLVDAIRPDTAAVLVSTVLFETSTRVEGLREVATRAQAVGAEVLFDAYHQFGVVPWAPIDARAFVVAGGYKYAQWGEGACFMRVPKHTSLRPVFTGWFSDFAGLAGEQKQIGYGHSPADRFAGSTYDPTSHYRARAVIRFFEGQGLSIPRLAENYRRQTQLLIDALTPRFAVLTPFEGAKRGGFVTVRVQDAASVVARMRAEGVWVDSRGENLRFGSAPYLRDEDLLRGVAAFERAVNA